jgi:hypothetical protein
MWLMTNFGMFSATLRPERTVRQGDERFIQVRSRRGQDLAELKARYMPMAGDIVRTTDSDYEYRIFCTHDDWALVVARLAHDIDYTNFKNSVKDNKLHTAYTRIWAVLYDAFSTNRYFDMPIKSKRRKGKKDRHSTVSSARVDLWTGWEDVDDEPAYDRRSVMDEFPDLQWR